MKEFKVVKRIRIIAATDIGDLEEKVNEFLETLHPNDLSEQGVQLCIGIDPNYTTAEGSTTVYAAKIEYTTKIELIPKKKNENKRTSS